MEMRFEKGEVIFREGVYEACMYRLVEGTVGVYARYGKENETLLTEKSAENKDYFGEIELLEAMPRTATVVAHSDVRAELITSASFGDFFENHPEQVYEIVRQLGRRLREVNRDHMETCRAAAQLEESMEEGGWFVEAIRKIFGVLEQSHIW